MRPVDEAAIATLRTLSADVLDPGTLAGLEKSIERDGIDGLTGAARAVVAALVRKHGQPGQPGYSSLHPDSGSGGSGSGAGGVNNAGSEARSHRGEGDPNSPQSRAAAAQAQREAATPKRDPRFKGPHGESMGYDDPGAPNGTSDGKAATGRPKEVIFSALGTHVAGKYGLSYREALQSNQDVAGHRNVPVADSVGLPKGSRGTVVGYRPNDDSRVFVAFGKPVTIGGHTATLHEMQATFDKDGPDNFYMTSLSALPAS